ncbi:hypothetical protein ISH97_26630 [Burkholderia pseudomallei]|nr:hypothetical protein [Burkholderia pseudomallei]
MAGQRIFRAPATRAKGRTAMRTSRFGRPMMDKTKQPPRAAKRCCRATLLAAAAFACCCGSYAAAQEAASAAPSTTTQPRDEAPLSAPLQVVQDAISAGTADVSANASADADVAMPLAEVAPPCSAPGACGAELRLAGGMGGCPYVFRQALSAALGW